MATFEELVVLERTSQDEKWGEQNLSPEKWLTILMEEIGEMSRSMLEQYPNPNKAQARSNRFYLEQELIQCAAVLKAMWDSGKRNGWL